MTFIAYNCDSMHKNGNIAHMDWCPGVTVFIMMKFKVVNFLGLILPGEKLVRTVHSLSYKPTSYVADYFKQYITNYVQLVN